MVVIEAEPELDVNGPTGRRATPPGKRTLSVAMCTCNGERYLREQLYSIAAQTRKPAELVVCDDRSADGTLDILEEFAAVAPFPVRVYRNPRRLGSTRNFERAIGHCKGEFIALADQDDVWYPHKLEMLLRELVSGAGLVFSDADVVNDCLEPLGFRVWQTAFFGPKQQRQVRSGGAFLLLLRGNVVTGATMAFRAEYRDWVLPISPKWVHDGWIAILIAAVGEVRFVREPLIAYRQHAANQIGARKPSYVFHFRNVLKTRTDLIEDLANLYDEVCSHIRAKPGDVVSPESRLHLRQKIDHGRVRIRVRRGSGHMRDVFGELVSRRYHVYAKGWLSFLKDLAILAVTRRRTESVRVERGLQDGRQDDRR